MPEPLRYYFDEDLHPTIAVQLRARGVEVLTTPEAGRAGQGISDRDQLTYATSHGRVLVTRDRHFITLATSEIPHSGIMLIQRSLSIGESIEYLELTAQVMTVEEMRNHLHFCDW